MEKPLLVYHPFCLTNYPTASVETPGRARAVYEALASHYEVIQPDPAEKADILRIHSDRLYRSVKKDDEALFEAACIAAGGAVRTAVEAYRGRPAFGILRPPGHHASPDSHWGFCFFNNMAIAVKALQARGMIKSAFILDFDLHFGDGTDNIFQDDPDVRAFNPDIDAYRETYMNDVKMVLDRLSGVDIVGVSAGFDIGEHDWGGLLKTEDFHELGAMVKRTSERLCGGKRFGILEGGYNLSELGKNALAFCRGLF